MSFELVAQTIKTDVKNNTPLWQLAALCESRQIDSSFLSNPDTFVAGIFAPQNLGFVAVHKSSAYSDECAESFAIIERLHMNTGLEDVAKSTGIFSDYMLAVAEELTGWAERFGTVMGLGSITAELSTELDNRLFKENGYDILDGVTAFKKL